MQTSPAGSIPRLLPLGAAVLFACGLVGCSGDDRTVRVDGDVAGLDTLTFPGDAPLTRPTREQLILDSLRLASDNRMRAATDSGSAAGTIDQTSAAGDRSGKSMTARAQARGDSMARAEARNTMVSADVSKRVKADTVRGVLTLIGSSAAPQVVLLTNQGTKEVTLSGMATAGLSKLAGIEVVVRGFLVSPRDVVVSDFIVRAVNNIPAYDGVLEEHDGGWVLTLTDGSGRKRLSVVPPTMRAFPGLRLWVSIRPGNAAPDSYGLIRR